MIDLVSRGLTTRTGVGILDSMGLKQLVASVSGVVLLVVGVVWSRPPPAEELERELTERLESSTLKESDVTLSVTDIKVAQADAAASRLRAYTAVGREKRVTATVRLGGEDVSSGFELDRVRFAALCNQAKVDADYEVREVHPEENSAVVSVTVHSRERDRICYFLTALENLRLIPGDESDSSIG